MCRLDRPRDFPTLLHAFRGVVHTTPNARLFIVGSGPARAEVEALVEELALAGSVTLWGFRSDVVRFYAAADVFVLASWGWEGLPISVIEAQATGVPVVVTDAGGSAEAIAAAPVASSKKLTWKSVTTVRPYFWYGVSWNGNPASVS